MTGPSTGPRAALLLLADGRFPAGGHAHSGGAESAVADGRITDAATLAAFCRARLHTTGLVAAALAAAAAARGSGPRGGRSAGFAAGGPGAAGGCFAVGELDEAADARTPSAALRTVSRRLGRQLLRAARAVWPDPELEDVAARFPRGAHQPVALGVTARVAGLGPLDAAYAAAYESVSAPATAAVRLLSLDPFHAAAVLARLAPQTDAVAAAAADAAHRALSGGLDVLPAASSPLLDIAAEDHATWPVRLFAS